MSLSIGSLMIKDSAMYVGEANHPKYGSVPVFGITASIATQHKERNVLIFPIPSDSTVSRNNIINTGTTAVLYGMVNTLDNSRGHIQLLPEIAYSIHFVSGAAQIEKELSEEGISDIVGLAGFSGLIGEFYPTCSMILCAFEGFEELKQFTLWIWYSPTKPEMFFLPTLVSNETVIEMNAEFPCDYWAMMSSSMMIGGAKLAKDEIPVDLMPYVPSKIVGRHITGWYKNGDTISSVENIGSGLSEGIHRRPLLGIWHG